MLTPDQIAAAQKANLETLFGLMNKAIDGVNKLAELNLSTAREALSDSERRVDAALSAKDAQELLALQTATVQPLMERTTTYTRQLYELAAGSGQELSRSLEAHAAEVQRAMDTLLKSAMNSAPAGSETAVTAMRNAVSTATEALEAMQKAFLQASSMAEQNLRAAATGGTPAAAKPARKR